MPCESVRRVFGKFDRGGQGTVNGAEATKKIPKKCSGALPLRPARQQWRYDIWLSDDLEAAVLSAQSTANKAHKGPPVALVARRLLFLQLTVIT
jgi:hypothetical protein